MSITEIIANAAVIQLAKHFADTGKWEWSGMSMEERAKWKESARESLLHHFMGK